MYVIRESIRANMFATAHFWVEFVSKDLQLRRSSKLDLKFDGKRHRFENLIYLNRKLYLFTSFNNISEHRYHLFVQEVDTQSLLPSRSLTSIAVSKPKNMSVRVTYGFRLSKDDNHLLVYYELPHEKKQPNRYHFDIFDRDFQKRWEKEVSLPYPEEQFPIDEYHIDNAGNVYLLGVLYNGGPNSQRRKNLKYHYVLLTWLEQGLREGEYAIDLPGKYFSDLTLREDEEGNLVFAGIYSEKISNNIRGYYFSHFDPYRQQFSDIHHQPLDFDFLTADMSKSEKERAKKAESSQDARRVPELENYYLDELILRSDGGAAIIAEQYALKVMNLDNPRTIYYIEQMETQHFKNIILINIHPDGTLQWTARIPKWQRAPNYNGILNSYALIVMDDKLYFLYNDNPRNYNPKRKTGNISKYKGNKGAVVLAVLNSNGELTRKPLASTSKSKISLLPQLCRKLSPHEILLVGKSTKGIRPGKLTFSE